MRLVSKIYNYIRNSLLEFRYLAKEARIAKVNDDYRISFRNFWYNDRPHEIWFYPLVQKLYKELDPQVGCRISAYRPHLEMRSVKGSPKRKPLSKAQASVFYTPECVRPSVVTRVQANLLVYGDYRLAEVDLALGFDPEGVVGHPNYMRLPIWILYYFTGLETKDEVAEKVATINSRRFQKTKFCAMIARHDANGLRTQMFHRLSNISRVDAAGRLLNNDDSLARQFADDKHKYLQQYKFTICPENTQGEGYVTEKLFHAFDAGCIPIYNGYSPDPEPEVINKDALIFWSEAEDNKDTICLIRGLYEDVGRYERFLSKRPLKESAVDYVWETLITLRGKFHAILPVRHRGARVQDSEKRNGV